MSNQYSNSLLRFAIMLIGKLENIVNEHVHSVARQQKDIAMIFDTEEQHIQGSVIFLLLIPHDQNTFAKKHLTYYNLIINCVSCHTYYAIFSNELFQNVEIEKV
jgi:hypothetical protein